MQPENAVISRATVDDAPEILALTRLAYQSEAALYPGITIPPLTQPLEELQSMFESHVFLKAVLSGAIIGSVQAAPQDDTCRIGRLVVHPDHRRRGLGSALMAAIEREFPDVPRYELFTGHRSVGNIRLYERLGYTETRRQRICDELTMVYMEKTAHPSKASLCHLPETGRKG